MEGMKELADFLQEQLYKDSQLSATLTLLELPNLLKLLKYLQDRGNPEETVTMATTLEALLHTLGRPHTLKEVPLFVKKKQGK